MSDAFAPRSPLAAHARPSRIGVAEGQEAGLRLAELPNATQIAIAAWRGREAAVRERVRSAHAIDLPQTPALVSADAVSALWTGPGEWLLIAADPGLEPALQTLLAGTAAVVDQSDLWTRFSLSGPAAGAVLARLVPIDLTRLRPGDAALTRAGHFDVRFWVMADRFGLSVFRSLAADFLQLVCETGAQFGVEVAG